MCLHYKRCLITRTIFEALTCDYGSQLIFANVGQKYHPSGIYTSPASLFFL